jgi:mannan endo-1,4-beta-mannosidase
LVCAGLCLSTAAHVGATAAKAGHHPRLAIGVFTPNAPDRSEIEHYTKLAHAAPAIVMWYSDFSSPLFSKHQMHEIRALHTTPLISWRPTLHWTQPIQFADIASGKYDGYLQRQAAKARAAHRQILLRWGYEMNLPGGVYGSHVRGETPRSYIAAWRHIVTVFRNARAHNVRFVWSPNTDCAGHCPFSAYFPGNHYVDWLGLDGYNFAAAHNAAWVTLRYVFASSYATITRLSSRPLMFSEVASAPSPGNKARWIRYGFTKTIPRDFPRVRAAVWFDSDKEADWRVNSSHASLRAWRKVVTSRRYSGTRATLARDAR